MDTFQYMDECCNGFRFEGLWERISIDAYANGVSTAASATLAYGNAGSAWCAVDAPRCSWCSLDALYASSYGLCDNDDATTCVASAPTWSAFVSYAQTGEQCATEVESTGEGGQEGGSSLSRISRTGACRDAKGRQGEYQRPLECSSRTRQSQGSLVGCGERAATIVVPMALVSPAVCHQVARVHGTIPDIRGLLPDTDERCHPQSSSDAKACRRCQEASGGSWHRRGHHCALGRRDGRDGDKGRWRPSTRRECAKDCRGVESGSEQPCRAVGVCRSARAQAEAAKERLYRGNRGIAWCFRLAKHAAFWQARHCVTNAYQCLGPSALCAPSADLLQWSHSILQEPAFLSPWMAIESAQDLAMEVGAWGPLRCEDFVLPSSSKKPKGKIRFADTVDVLVGQDVSGEFHIQKTLTNDLKHVHGPLGPNLCPGGQPGESSGSVHQGPAASSSTGRSSNTHFLDRRLPQGLPGYVHHLQQLWRDSLLRVPDGQAYTVRTWYLHHVHQRVWTVPRAIQLPADPMAWHHELLTAWRDQLHNDEVLNIAVVFPEVRALQGVLPAHADLILVQGDHAQAGGVTTVFPPAADAHGSYTWATSLPRHVSGMDILTAANADVILQSHACDLFHGGVVIPTTNVPTHWMQNGHSFVAVFQDLHGDTTSRLPTSTATTEATEGTGHFAADPATSLVHDAEQAEESSPVESSSFDEEELRGLHIFGLHQPHRHCFVRWTTYTNILLDVLRDVGLHRDLAIGFHHVQVPLIDQHVAEEAIILQRVGDIPPGSPDQLVVVDIVFESSDERMPAPPRRVVRFPRFLCRNLVLQHLQMTAVCDRDRPAISCLIFFNRVYWDPDDDAPREFTHGVYLRVIVLPPKTYPEAAVDVRRCDRDEHPSTKRPRRSSSGSPHFQNTPTGSSLLQTSFKRHGDLQMSAFVHSATFPSLAYTNVPAAVQAEARGRMLPPLNHNWIAPLSHTFAMCSGVEFQDEGPVQYWTTWYLHQDRYPRNTESRILRLDRFRQHWYRDLRNLWGDVLDHGRAAWVHLITPKPPEDSERPTAGHLVLVQAPQEAIPTLLTAAFDHPVHRRIWHVAAFLPPFAAHSDVIDILGVQRWSSSRACHFQAGTAPWLSHELIALHPGEHVLVTVLSSSRTPVVAGTSFMQLSATLESSASSSDHVTAAEVHPSPLTIPRTMPTRFDRAWREQMQDFFERNAVIEMEEEGPVLYVWTWFINHRTARECREPVAVRLTSQADRWWRDLMEAWREHLQVDALTQVNIISPRPWTDQFRIDTLHLMVEQYPSEPYVAGIISTFLHESHGDRVHQMAYSLPRWLCTTDLIDFLHLNHLCDVYSCNAMAGIRHFEKFIRHDVYDAISIEVHMRSPQCPRNHQAASASDPFVRRPVFRDDIANFLQITKFTTLRTRPSSPEVRSWNTHQGLEKHLPMIDSFQPDASCDQPPIDKIDADFQRGQQEMQSIAQQHNHFPRIPPGQPPLIHDLHHFLQHHALDWHDHAPEVVTIALWYADHDRRPHSGLSREVRLTGDVTQWYHDILIAWEDWLDPFVPLIEVIVHPTPLDGQAEVFAHLILVQRAHPHRCSIVVAIVDSADDPWHPRLLCLTVPCLLSHELLCGYVDLDRLCGGATGIQCSTFLGDRDLTHTPQFEASHGMHLTFQIRRPERHQVDDVASVASSAVFEDDVEALSFIQKDMSKRTIRLEDHIPAPRFTTVDCQKVLYLREQLKLEPHLQPEQDVTSVWWHASTWYSLDYVPPWQRESVLGMTFYTDGSAVRSSPKAAAGVFLIVHTIDGLRFGGFLTAKCLGLPTAPRAEATALILAVLWMRQLVQDHAAEASWFEIAFDCEHTANIAQGLQIAHNNSDLSVVLRSLVQWIEVFLPAPLAWTHHRSHQGNPWNEAADTICRHALQHDEYTTSLDSWFDTCTFQAQDLSTIQWLWLVEKSILSHSDAPVLIGTQWRFDVEAPFSSSPSALCHPAVLRRRQVEDDCADHQRLALHVATANVLTLYPDRDGAATFFSARAESLAAQFLQEGLHVVGLQETRSRASGHSFFDAFHVLSGSATKRGQGGVQLWMRKQIPTTFGNIEIGVSDLRILHATSQRLVVRWAHPGCRILFVVAHAPTDEDEEILQAFWDATTDAIPVAYRQWKTIVLADANSRLGSVTSPAVGPHHADEENGKGACFHSWLLNHNLFVPQTFPLCHEGEGHTWTHPKGTTARIDFVAISNDVKIEDVATWISSNVDLTLHRRDHECVCASIGISYFPADRRPRDKRVSQVLEPSTDVAWPLDVHTHAAQLQHWIKQRNPVVRQWRKRHLTDSTKKLIEAKRFHWKRYQDVRRHVRFGLLRHLFHAWRTSQPTAQSFSAWIKLCDHAAAWHQWVFDDLAPRVVHAVREDDQEFFHNLATGMSDASSKGCRQMWQAIRHVLPRWRAKRRSNLRCTGPSLEAQFQHYDALEAGHSLTYEDLLAQCHQAQHEDAADIPLQISLDSLPSRLHVESLGCRISTQKAPGIDWVAPVALQNACQQHSAVLHQFLLKVWILGAEPLQGKGGLLHPIAKKEVSHRIEGMRGIMLIDGLGKIIHSHLRGQFLPALESMRLPLQLGGFARSSTLFATMYVRAFTQLAAKCSLSSAVIFVDIRSAFHSMIRQIVFGGSDMHPTLQHLLERTNMDLTLIQQRLDGTPPLDQLPISQPAARLLRDGHRCTWYTLGASEAIHQTERGSRPGSPLADVAFNSLMSLVLKELQTRLDQHGPLQTAFAALGLRAIPVAWVDDLAVPVVAMQASALESVIQWTLRTMMDVCSSFGLQLNLQPRKTEVVPTFRGVDAPACRRTCYREQLARIPIPQSDFVVRCVPLYEHLGTMFQGDGGIDAELRHRLHKASLACKQVQRRLLRNRHLSVVVRLRLLETLILPILFHGAGNWPLLGHAQMHRLHSAYIKWIRSILGNGFWAPDQLTDLQILLRWQLPTIALRLAKHRLLFAFHLFADAPQLIVDVVTAVADAPRSWFSALRQALDWAHTMDLHFFEDDPQKMTPDAILQWFHVHRADGPRWVRRLYRRAIHQGSVIGEALAGHRAIRQQLEIGGASFDASVVPPESPEHQHECHLCAKTFATQRQWQNHLWCAHGEPSDERRYMTSTTCSACWTCHWTVNRLQIHLRQSRRHPYGCYERLTWLHDPLEFVEPIDEADRDDRPQRFPAETIPHVLNVQEFHCHTREDADRRWQQACRVENFHPPTNDVWVEECKTAFDAVLRDHPRSSVDPDDILWRLSCLADDFDDGSSQGHGAWALALWFLDDLRFSRFLQMDVHFFGRCYRAIRQMVHQSPIGHLTCWQRRMDEAYMPDLQERPVHGEPRAGSGFESLLDPVRAQHELLRPILQPMLKVPPCQGIPIDVTADGPVLWVLHLFSGRRRVGDCHWWLQHIGSHLWPDMDIRIVSLDTAVHPVLGNLATGPNVDRARRLAERGLIAGILTGPPCETWSAARHIELENENGPRPLRSAALPWSLTSCTGKEMVQATTGTQLLLNSWNLEVAAVTSGAASIMEHPWEAENSDRASVWRTDVHQQWLMRLPGAFRHCIRQYLFGSKGVKPTCLRAINLGEPEVMAKIIQEGSEMWRPRPTLQLAGRSECGTFRTAAAKEYPSALCRTLIVALIRGLHMRARTEGLKPAATCRPDDMQWIQAAWRASEDCTRDSFLPDFQGA